MKEANWYSENVLQNGGVIVMDLDVEREIEDDDEWVTDEEEDEEDEENVSPQAVMRKQSYRMSNFKGM